MKFLLNFDKYILNKFIQLDLPNRTCPNPDGFVSGDRKAKAKLLSCLIFRPFSWSNHFEMQSFDWFAQ